MKRLPPPHVVTFVITLLLVFAARSVMAQPQPGLKQLDQSLGPVLNSAIDGDAGAGVSVAYLYQPTAGADGGVYIDLRPITNTDGGPVTDASVCPDATPAELGLPSGVDADTGSVPSVAGPETSGDGYVFVTASVSGTYKVYFNTYTNTSDSECTAAAWSGWSSAMGLPSGTTITSAPAAVTDHNGVTYVIVAGNDGTNDELLETDDSGTRGTFPTFTSMDNASGAAAAASIPAIAEYQITVAGTPTWYVWATATEHDQEHIDTWVASSNSSAAALTSATVTRVGFVSGDTAYSGCVFAAPPSGGVRLGCQDSTTGELVYTSNTNAGFGASPTWSGDLAEPSFPGAWPPAGYSNVNSPVYLGLSATHISGAGSVIALSAWATWKLSSCMSGCTIDNDVQFWLFGNGDWNGSYSVIGYSP
jgi:hypothetical protein